MELGNLIFGNSRGEFPVERGDWQKCFCKFIEDIGLDSYGYVPAWASDSLKKHQTARGGFENDVFIINPYYWGDDDTEKVKPNFIFKKTGYTLDWYKYPLRDSYANQDISFAEFKEMLEECKKSIK